LLKNGWHILAHNFRSK